MSIAFVFLTVPTTLYFKDISYQFLMNNMKIISAGTTLNGPTPYFNENTQTVGKLIKFALEYDFKKDILYGKVKKCIDDANVRYFSLIVFAEGIGTFWNEDSNIQYPDER